MPPKCGRAWTSERESLLESIRAGAGVCRAVLAGDSFLAPRWSMIAAH